MGSLIDTYRSQLKKLLPPGLAWTRDIGSNMHKLMDGIAVEAARIHERADDLLSEMTPDSTIELLSEWENVWGLPDQCTGPLSNIADRKMALLARIRFIGDQSPGFFIRLAASLGYAITITENVDGDPYVWSVHVAETATIKWARAGSARAGDQIRSWGVEMLECAIRNVNPAHLTVLFVYE